MVDEVKYFMVFPPFVEIPFDEGFYENEGDDEIAKENNAGNHEGARRHIGDYSEIEGQKQVREDAFHAFSPFV